MSDLHYKALRDVLERKYGVTPKQGNENDQN